MKPNPPADPLGIDLKDRLPVEHVNAKLVDNKNIVVVVFWLAFFDSISPVEQLHWG